MCFCILKVIIPYLFKKVNTNFDKNDKIKMWKIKSLKAVAFKLLSFFYLIIRSNMRSIMKTVAQAETLTKNSPLPIYASIIATIKAINPDAAYSVALTIAGKVITARVT